MRTNVHFDATGFADIKSWRANPRESKSDAVSPGASGARAGFRLLGEKWQQRWRADLQAGAKARGRVSFATKSPEELGSVVTLLCLVILSRAMLQGSPMLQHVRISFLLSLSNIPYICLAHASQNLVADLLFLSILLDIHPDVELLLIYNTIDIFFKEP